MPEIKLCPDCEGELRANAAQSYCPACLLRQGMECDATNSWDGFEPVAEDEPNKNAPDTARPILEGPGSRIGPYKLLQKIGEGGMGAVYMAEQEKPVRRRVAFKIIKPGMDTNQVIARFEAERQAHALMDHQHIAKVLDAGATDTGRPYFVMELVRGVPITKYCDRNQLTPQERLELFVPVCNAIQHAHQKGIIHRDIKPSNVLVTLYDGKPGAKVIDFGVAKATDQRLTERTMFTEFGQVIGTFEYMSPEQAGWEHLTSTHGATFTRWGSCSMSC
jgi:eukaryotic-like serine/threonine-protein kinase